MIDQFDLETFEEYLKNSHNPYLPLGEKDGEYAYILPLDGQSAIEMRSSIKLNGQAAENGKNSIRCWLVDNEGQPIGSKIDSWTTRVNGWRNRLFVKILELVKRRIDAGDCRECEKPFGTYKRKSDGLLFVKCWPCSNRMGRPIHGNLNNEGWFSEASGGNGNLQMQKQEDELDTKEISENNSKSNLDAFLNSQPATSQVFKSSKYQTAIYDFVENGYGHGVVEGVAGCGKTTTNVEALKLVPQSDRTRYAAFSKHIEQDISAKAPAHVSVKTFHGWGYADIRKALPNIEKPNKYKVHSIIDNLAPVIDNYLKFDIVTMVSLLKGTMADTHPDTLTLLADNFNLDIPEDRYGLVRKVFDTSITDRKVIDFDDMVYYPASNIVKCSQFDNIFIDEMQDMNTGQYQLAKNSLADGGRILGIGDPNQSIFAFRGAHMGIMDYMADEMSATRLPLTISYRAPLAIVELVNKEYPSIKFEAAPGAKDGAVDWIGSQQFYDTIRSGDSALCRTNAPLIKPCFRLIQQGVKAVILGRDIGAGLVKLIEKREKLQRVTDLNKLLIQINIYCNNEIARALDLNRLARASMLQDQKETVIALSDGCNTIQELKRKTKAMFVKEKNDVTFSSIHKAKGIEWRRVFVIGPKGNHPMGNRQQETNIRYVRDTRTLDQLYYVN